LKEDFVASLANVATFARKRLSSSVGRNVISLYVLQFGNYVLPLATVPYLVRVLGPEKFGLVAFGQGLMAYFSLAVNYGFDWSCTRKVALHRDDPELVNQIAANVWGAKALLCAATLVLLLILLTLLPGLRAEAPLLLVLYVSVLGSMLFPAWLFQGLERMSAISVTNLCARTLGAVAIFLFIRRPADFLIYAIIFSAQGLVAGLIGAGVAFKMFQLHLFLPSWRGVLQEISESTPLFCTTAAIGLYTSGNAFILGLLTSPVVVGYYSGAEKIVTSVLGLIGPLFQALFPHITKLAGQSREFALRAARKALFLLGTFGLGMTTIVICAAPLIVRILLGPRYTDSIGVLRILAVNIFNVSVATVWSTLVMISFKRDRAVMILVLLSGCLNLALAFILVPLYAEKGMATAVVCAETLVNVGSFAYTWAHNLNPSRIQHETSVG
jgi:PST family polysaccharide transporter